MEIPYWSGVVCPPHLFRLPVGADRGTRCRCMKNRVPCSSHNSWDDKCNIPDINNPAKTNSDTANLGSLSLGKLNADGSPSGSRIPSAKSSEFNSFALGAYLKCPNRENSVRYPMAGNDPTKSANYLGGRDVQTYALDDGKTGVMYIATFLPDPPSEACVDRFVVDLVMGIRNLTEAGVKNILVDTSNNGGGAVVLSQTAQRLFTGDDLLKANNFQSVFRKAPLAMAMHDYYRSNPGYYRSGAFAPNAFRPADSIEDYPPTTDIFSPGDEFIINGKRLLTSNRLFDSLTRVQTYDAELNISDEPPFAASNIVFTGNGLCGSACASFTNFLIEYYNATAYIAAAQPSLPIEFTAFAAGEAGTAAQMYAEADSIGFKDDKLLPRLKHAGDFGFALRAGISPNVAPGTFLQYRSYPAQNRFAMTRELYESPVKMWNYIAGQVFA